MYRVIHIHCILHTKHSRKMRTSWKHFSIHYIQLTFSERCILSIFVMVVQFEIVCIKSFGLVLEFEMYQSIFNVFGTPFLFQFPRRSYLFLEGVTFHCTIPVACEILGATRATFLEVLFSRLDTPGSGGEPTGSQVCPRTLKMFISTPIQLLHFWK